MTCWDATHQTIAKVTPCHLCGVWMSCAAVCPSPTLWTRSVSSSSQLCAQIGCRREGRLSGRSWLLWLCALLALDGEIKPAVTVYINFVWEGSSLLAAVWRCQAENPAFFIPLKELVSFKHLKQHVLKVAKLRHSGISPLLPLSSCIALCQWSQLPPLFLNTSRTPAGAPHSVSQSDGNGNFLKGRKEKQPDAMNGR